MINTLRKNCLAQESPCQIVLVHPICCFFLWGYFATKQLYFMKTSEQWYTCAELYDWIAIVLYSIMLQNILQFLKIFFLLLKGRAGHKFGSVNSVTWQQCCGSEWIRWVQQALQGTLYKILGYHSSYLLIWSREDS